MGPKVRTERDGAVLVVTIDRPEVRNAVDPETASLLYDAFAAFDADEELAAAVLTGAGGTFCAGADLKAVAGIAPPVTGAPRRPGNQGPLGPTRMLLGKPVIAAVEGYAVAGGLELAAWCDLRIAADNAVFGCFERRWGVPLIDGGTIRLSRLLGHSHALDLILTGRPVSGEEARTMGLANRLVPPGEALTAALALARELAGFPQRCMRGDRKSSYEQWGLSLEQALVNEARIGRDAIQSGETRAGAERFAAGEGRHGTAVPGG